MRNLRLWILLSTCAAIGLLGLFMNTEVTAGPPIGSHIPVAAPDHGTATPMPPATGNPVPFWHRWYDGQFFWGNVPLHPTDDQPIGHCMTNALPDGSSPPPPFVRIDVRFFSDGTDPDGSIFAEVTTTPPGTTVTYHITTP